MTQRGCGIIFYSPKKDSVLVFRRDNKNTIPFPNMLDLLGGHVEEGEDPETAVIREMAEELQDLRTGKSYVLQRHRLMLRYTDDRGCEQSIFTCDIDFEISDIRLLEGQELVWMTRQEVYGGLKMAFDFEDVLRKFFSDRAVPN